MSLGSRLVFALTAPLIGYAGDRLTLPQTLWLQAGMLALAAAVLGVAWTRIAPKYHVVKPAPSR